MFPQLILILSLKRVPAKLPRWINCKRFCLYFSKIWSKIELRKYLFTGNQSGINNYEHRPQCRSTNASLRLPVPAWLTWLQGVWLEAGHISLPSWELEVEERELWLQLLPPTLDQAAQLLSWPQRCQKAPSLQLFGWRTAWQRSPFQPPAADATTFVLRNQGIVNVDV